MTLQPKIGETEARPERLPLEEYLERYRTYLRVTRGLSRNTLLAYGRDVAVFQAFLRDHGVWDARAVSPQTMTHYMDGLHRMGLAAVSRARALAAVRSLFRFLKQEGIVTVGPTLSLRSAVRARRLPKT